MIQKLSCAVIAIVMVTSISAQKTFDIPGVYYEWNELKNSRISRSGAVITYEINKLKGDGFLHIQSTTGSFHDSIARASKARIAADDSFVVFRIEAPYDSLRKLKLEGVSEKEYPKDSMGIYFTGDQRIEKHARVISYKRPVKDKSWIAWLHAKKDQKANNAEKDTSEAADAGNRDTLKTNNRDTINGKELIIYHPESGYKTSFDNVKRYSFSRNGKLLIFTRSLEDEEDQDTCQVWLFDTGERKAEKQFEKPGAITATALDRQGQSHAYIFTEDTADINDYSVFLNQEMLVDSTTDFLNEGWQVSPHSSLSFSKNGERLLFGTAPVPSPEKEDSLIKDEKFKVDIWHWQDKRLQPQQKNRLKQEKQRTYTAFYDLTKKRFLQLEDKDIRHARILKNNTADLAYGFVFEPYQRQRSWTGRSYRDVYAIDLEKNRRRLVLEKHGNRRSYSPSGRYFVYYNAKDSCWWAMDLKKENKTNLTKDLDIKFFDKHHDTPNQPYAFQVAGWDKQQHVYVYDRYDIWKIDASGKNKPANLTAEYGRENNLRLRYIKTDREADYIPQKMLLSVFDYDSKESGFAHCKTIEPNPPEILYKGAFRTSNLKKAKNSDTLIFQKGNFQDYPDLWLSNIRLEAPEKVSNTNPQQSQYLWGEVEHTDWISGNGDSLSGLIYKPENFDASKKYPMIVYFYERYSNRKHSHYIPKPSHSVINFTHYVNDGYIIFIPDIHYRTGYPGRSAEDAVISGSLHMLKKGYIDVNRIGLQGQSWGGYQVAHLITRTDMYAAAMAGAPVSNMTSAYGGIRWGSGHSRAFQYEKTQSRIGGTLWDKPMHYIENSPLFFAPDVNTPLLMMHNDEDGAVPWYQGIEFFNALRRLDKTSYLLVYNNDKHNLRHWGNRIDLSIRMKQFFDHYLKGKNMPVWMKDGIPAIEKGKKTGYERTD
ncbi:MAG: prolyl oligopeptidase family serine peptidase [Bacteroidales bacterium]